MGASPALSSNPYGLSDQDFSDLQQIRAQLPQGDPRGAKIDTLLATKPQPQAQQPQASIGSAQTGVLPWLRSLESDIRYGSNQTLPGRALHAIGMQPTASGVSEGAEQQIASPILGPLRAAQGAANIPSHPWQGTKQLGLGLLQSASLPLSFVGPGAVGDEAPQAVRGIADAASEGTQAASNKLAQLLRNPATARQSQIGRAGTVKNFLPSILQRFAIPEALVPKGVLGSATNPGPYMELPWRVPLEKPPGLGSIAERDATALNKVPFAGEQVQEPSSIIERDATRQNTPFAGEEEAPAAQAGTQAAQMPKPLRPTVGTPEEWQAYEQQMARLRQEASDAGTYSAARGSTKPKLNYQQKIGKRLVQ